MVKIQATHHQQMAMYHPNITTLQNPITALFFRIIQCIKEMFSCCKKPPPAVIIQQPVAPRVEIQPRPLEQNELAEIARMDLGQVNEQIAGYRQWVANGQGELVVLNRRFPEFQQRHFFQHEQRIAFAQPRLVALQARMAQIEAAVPAAPDRIEAAMPAADRVELPLPREERNNIDIMDLDAVNREISEFDAWLAERGEQGEQIRNARMAALQGRAQRLRAAVLPQDLLHDISQMEDDRLTGRIVDQERAILERARELRGLNGRAREEVQIDLDSMFAVLAAFRERSHVIRFSPLHLAGINQAILGVEREIGRLANQLRALNGFERWRIQRKFDRMQSALHYLQNRRQILNLPEPVYVREIIPLPLPEDEKNKIDIMDIDACTWELAEFEAMRAADRAVFDGFNRIPLAEANAAIFARVHHNLRIADARLQALQERMARIQAVEVDEAVSRAIPGFTLEILSFAMLLVEVEIVNNSDQLMRQEGEERRQTQVNLDRKLALQHMHFQRRHALKYDQLDLEGIDQAIANLQVEMPIRANEFREAVGYQRLRIQRQIYQNHAAVRYLSERRAALIIN